MNSEVYTDTEVVDGDSTFEMPRSANDVIAEALRQKVRPPMFDAFWQGGEVALLFGEAGAGKSVLATQIAEALARGKPIDGFVMPKRRHKVLYVDLNLSAVQFQRRYTPESENGGKPSPYRFAERFHRGCPPYGKDVVAWITKAVALFNYEVVVIDDLSAVMRTADGTFDSLKVMREMKRLSQATGVSVLVLADSMPNRRGLETTEADLRRSRVLCSVADSVFGIGTDSDGQLKLRQFRSQVGKIEWGGNNAIRCKIVRHKSRLLAMEFDSRFGPKFDIKKWREIKAAFDQKKKGYTYDEIAAEMGISRSRAYRLVHECTPYILSQVEWFDAIRNPKSSEPIEKDKTVDDNENTIDEEYDTEETDDEEYEDEEYEEDCDEEEEYEDHDESEDDDDVRTGSDSDWASDDPEDDDDVRTGSDSDWVSDEPEENERLERERRAKLPWYQRIDPHEHPFASGIRPLSIYDFESEFDEYGNQLFVESRSKQTGKRKVWYTITNPTRRTRRHVDNGWNIQNNIVSNSHWLPRRE